MHSPLPRFGRNLPRAQGRRAAMIMWALALWLGSIDTGVAAPADPGRLFYTPAQRAQLEAARTRNVTQPGPGKQASSGDTQAPLRYDGVVIRSDGKTTRWVDGKPQLGAASVHGLKPGQIRANGKVYESYQVLPPAPPAKKPDIEIRKGAAP